MTSNTNTDNWTECANLIRDITGYNYEDYHTREYFQVIEKLFNECPKLEKTIKEWTKDKRYLPRELEKEIKSGSEIQITDGELAIRLESLHKRVKNYHSANRWYKKIESTVRKWVGNLGTAELLSVLAFIFLLLPIPIILHLQGSDWANDSYSAKNSLVPSWVMLVVLLVLFGGYIWAYITNKENVLNIIVAGITFLVFILAGFPFNRMFLLILSVVFEVGGLLLLKTAVTKIPSNGERTDLYDFLENAVVKVEKNDEIKIWKWKTEQRIIFTILVIVGFLLVSYTLSPLTKQLLIKTKQPSMGVNIIYPSWLSYDDKGEITLESTISSTITMTPAEIITVTLEPKQGIDNMIIIKPEENTNCTPCTLQISPSITTTKVFQWELLTPPLTSFVNDRNWQVQLRYTQSPTNSHFIPISIPKLKIGFGIWSFFRNRTLTGIFTIIFSIAFAMMQIWLMQKIGSTQSTII